MKNARNSYKELDSFLADYLLSLTVGDQLLSMRDLAKLSEVSLGSISNSISYLEEIGAVTISRRGRLGSYLERKATGALWSIVNSRPMVIALTLPSFPKCEGLATAIHSLLNGAGLETYLIFIRGSIQRLEALRKGQCDAAVMSMLAAEELSEDGEAVVLRLPPRSFVTDHRVFYRRKSVGRSQPLTVGIDYDSFDIKYLTELEFAESEVNFQPITLTQIDLYLEKSSVDAAISNLDHINRLTHLEFTSRPLSPSVQEIIGERDTSAVVMTRANASSTKIALKELLVPEKVMEIQGQVVAGSIVPRY